VLKPEYVNHKTRLVFEARLLFRDLQ